MTIVASEDGRNAAWASDKSGFGHKMLAKMGWSEGKGLGKNKQGQTHNLRAIRREESLGIGASTDTHGSEGFSQTSANFRGVLAKLNAEHGSGSSSGASSDEDSGSTSSNRTASTRASLRRRTAEVRDARSLERGAVGLRAARGLACLLGYSASEHDGFSQAHQNAKTCPRRPKAHRDAAAFTVQQRDAWLGHLSQACDARAVNLNTKTELLAWAVGNMSTYGPFIQE